MTIGVIGCGNVTENVHLPVLLAMGHTIIWVHDSNRVNLKNLSKHLDLPFDENQTLLNLPEPDIILIAVPYGARKDIYKIIQSRFLNSSLFLEKPVALTLEEHIKIENLRPANRIAVNFNRRSYGLLSKIQSIVDHNLFGNIESISFNYGGFGIKTAGKYYSNKQMSGGGTLFEVAIHNLDFLAHLLKPEEIDVDSVDIEYINNFDVDTAGTIYFSIADKKVPLQFLVSNIRKIDNMITMRFENAIIKYSLFDDSGIQVYSSDNSYIMSITNNFLKPHKVFDTQYKIWRDFISGVNAGVVNYTNLITSRQTTELIEKIYAYKA
jgi:predicted dehydrogenase